MVVSKQCHRQTLRQTFRQVITKCIMETATISYDNTDLWLPYKPAFSGPVCELFTSSHAGALLGGHVMHQTS